MSGQIREQRQKCHYSSSTGVESRTGTVVESKKRLTSKRNFVLDSTTFLNFRVPDSTKSLPVHCDDGIKKVREQFFRYWSPRSYFSWISWQENCQDLGNNSKISKIFQDLSKKSKMPRIGYQPNLMTTLDSLVYKCSRTIKNIFRKNNMIFFKKLLLVCFF